MSTPIRATRRRRSLGLAVGLSLAAGTLTGLAPSSPASAVSAPNPPENPHVAPDSTTQATITYDNPTGGAAPTFYRVAVDDLNTAASPDVYYYAPSTDHSITFAITPSPPSPAPLHQYQVTLTASNGAGASAPATFLPAGSDTFDAPRTSSPVVVTGPFTPFSNGDAFIRQNFVDYLGRAPRFDELNFFRQALTTGGGGSMTQNEFLEFLRQEPEQDPSAASIIRLYIAYFLRNPDYTGYEHYRKARAEGIISAFRISAQFADSSEFTRKYGSLDDGEFVSLVYRNVLGRNPDSSGYAYYTRQLQNGVSRGAVMLSFSESREFQRLNKVAVATAEIFGAMLKRMPVNSEYDLFITNPAVNTGGTELSQSSLNIIYDAVQDTNLGHTDTVIRYRTVRIPPIIPSCGPLIQPVACYGPGGITAAEQEAYDHPVAAPVS